jgi:methyl-accepting chemotaxis protein
MKGKHSIKFGSLGFKLLVCFIIMTLVPLIGYASYNINKSETTLKQQFEVQTQQQLDANLKDVLDAQQTVIVELSHTPVIKSMDYKQIEPYFQRFVKDNTQYSHLLICDPEGTEVAHSEGAEHHGKNIADKEYFSVPWETGKPVIADATFSTSTGRKIVGLGVPILNEAGEKTGVLVGFISLEYISERVVDKKVTDSGYTFMLNKKGDYISHPNKDKLLTENILKDSGVREADKDVFEKMIAQQPGINEVIIDGKEMIINYKPAEINGWSIAMVSPVDEVYALASKMKSDTVKAIIIIAVLILIASVVITRFVLRPIKGYMTMVEAKDFTKKIKSNDELGQSFNVLATELQTMLSNISDGVDKLSTSSEQFKNISVNTALAANEVAASIQEISKSTQNQEITTNNVTSFISKLNTKLVNMKDNLENTKETSESAFNSAQNGQKLVEHMAFSVNSLSNKTSQINSIVDTISSIAEQTNLLALNAAIEAARAGDQGRGFAVVAEEVRKLASQSSEATTKIGNLLQEITINIEEVVKIATDHGTSNNVVRVFEEILDKNKIVSNSVLTVVTDARVIQEESENILQEAINAVELVAAATENVENIASHTEEQTATVEELSSSAEELNLVAVNMKNEINKFKY